MINTRSQRRKVVNRVSRIASVRGRPCPSPGVGHPLPGCLHTAPHAPSLSASRRNAGHTIPLPRATSATTARQTRRAGEPQRPRRGHSPPTGGGCRMRKVTSDAGCAQDSAHSSYQSAPSEAPRYRAQREYQQGRTRWRGRLVSERNTTLGGRERKERRTWRTHGGAPRGDQDAEEAGRAGAKRRWSADAMHSSGRDSLPRGRRRRGRCHKQS